MQIRKPMQSETCALDAQKTGRERETDKSAWSTPARFFSSSAAASFRSRFAPQCRRRQTDNYSFVWHSPVRAAQKKNAARPVNKFRIRFAHILSVRARAALFHSTLHHEAPGLAAAVRVTQSPRAFTLARFHHPRANGLGSRDSLGVELHVYSTENKSACTAMTFVF